MRIRTACERPETVTLGSLVARGTSFFILSNDHVLALSNAGDHKQKQGHADLGAEWTALRARIARPTTTRPSSIKDTGYIVSRRAHGLRYRIPTVREECAICPELREASNGSTGAR